MNAQVQSRKLVSFMDLHPDQVGMIRQRWDRRGGPWRANDGGRFKAVRCGRRWGKCLAKGSRIAMADGTYRVIEKVVPGDLVLTVNESTGTIEAKAVLAVLPNGIKEVIEVQTSSRRLVCTPNHPLMTGDDWTEARDIAAGTLVITLPMIDGDLALEAVTSTAPLAAVETWDLSLADNHNFFAEGVCTHNTEVGKSWAGEAAVKGQPVGWFAPSYKILKPAFQQMKEALAPMILSSSATAGEIRLVGGGEIAFWSLDNEDAGRGRKFKRMVIDEAAFTKANMMDVWKRALKPTLLDLRGEALVISNTNGIKPDNFMWQVCNQPEHGFIEYHAPSWNNPHVPERLPGMTDEEHAKARLDEFEAIRRGEEPLVFQQEYAAEFVDFSGMAFFSKDLLLEGGAGIAVPENCDSVFATVDTAVKTGSKNDGTAVIYWARSKHYGHPLVMLGWDIIQIQGDLLEVWLNGVFENLEYWSRRTSARSGSLGAFIEDKATGMVLIMAAQRRGLPAQAIDSVLTSIGKDERAVSVSGYHYRGEVKMTHEAYDKVSVYKGKSANQVIDQVCGFRVGVKNQADDLTDAYCYGLAIGLGDSDGI